MTLSMSVLMTVSSSHDMEVIPYPHQELINQTILEQFGETIQQLATYCSQEWTGLA